MTAPIVIKLGGGVLDGDLSEFWSQILELSARRPVVIVHGGGKQSTRLAQRLGHAPQMVEGRRVTTDTDLDVMRWVIRGELSTALVSSAQRSGVRAVGVSGVDGSTILVKKRPPWRIAEQDVDFGHVGDVVQVNPAVIESLLNGGFVPVVATMGIDADGAVYNVNGDTVAQELALALGADELILATESGGVLDSSGRPIRELDAVRARQGVQEGWIRDGMKVKTEVGLGALEKGVASVRISGLATVSLADAGTRLTAGTTAEPRIAAEPRSDVEPHPEVAPRTTTSRAATKPHPTTISTAELHALLVAIPSLSRQEKPAADALEAYLRRFPLDVSRIGDNVIASLGEGNRNGGEIGDGGDDGDGSESGSRNEGGSESRSGSRNESESGIGNGNGPRTLLLNSHLDVVPPSTDHPFPPFEPTLKDGNVYGRGAVDAKASVAAMATALCNLAQEGWAPPGGRVIAAFTVCEETGGEFNGLEEILPQLPRPSAALVGEPTMMQPCIAQKGLLILKMVSEGRTAHAARPAEGENAISKAAHDITRIEALTFEKVHPHLGPTTANVTMVQGGTARNVIPDQCITWIDIRSTPSYTHPELTKLIQDVVESRIEVHSERFVPVDTHPESDIVRACIRASPTAQPFGSPTMSDWIHLRGIPTVKIGPGDSHLSHTADEHVSLDQLNLAYRMYQDIIAAYFDANPAEQHDSSRADHVG